MTGFFMNFGLDSIGQKQGESDRIERYRAARTVAAGSIDAADCALLLELLGLEPKDGFTVRDR
nr:hypothetical protein [Sciscionella marina]